MPTAPYSYNPMIIATASRLVLLISGLLLCDFNPSLHAAALNSAGRDVYRQHCVQCHGKAGEGVKGKYDDALHGDWSVEKLTRYIDKNMPEDDPDKCDADQYAAVSRYINDAFYSRAARARNNPARVELVRLTNRQYVNTVADLIRSFSGTDGAATAEHGLKANYRSRIPKSETERKNIDRVDRQDSSIPNPAHPTPSSSAPAPTRLTSPGAARSSPMSPATTSSSSRRRTARACG